MANAVVALDTAILNHLKAHPKAHPMSSPYIRRLAQHTDECRDGRLPNRVIEERMRQLRKEGRWSWCPSRRYVVQG